jgi:hypothetical protein
MWSSRDSSRYYAALIGAARTASAARAPDRGQETSENSIRSWWAARRRDVHRNEVLLSAGTRAALVEYAARAASVENRDNELRIQRCVEGGADSDVALGAAA